MKKGIHPENYRTVLFYESNAKQGFLIRSCARTTTTMKWEDGKEYHRHHTRFIPAKHAKSVTKVVLANSKTATANSAH